MHRRTLAALLGALLCLAVSASAASASTLDNSGGVVTFTGAADTETMVHFAETAANTVRVDIFGDDVTNTPSGCTDVTDPGDPPGLTRWECTGVNSVVANLGNMDDSGAGSDVGDPDIPGKLTSLPLTIDGGDGNDGVIGGDGNDVVNGGAGDDFAAGDVGPVNATTGPGGNDTIDGGPGRDFVGGGKGDDTVTSGADDDDGAAGGPGTDTVSGGAGDDDFLAGGPGNDTVNGEDGIDFLAGDCDGTCGPGGPPPPGIGVEGNDVLNGGAGGDVLDGDGGDDVLNGNAGGDTYFHEPGADVLNGGDGIDRVTYVDEDPNTGDPLTITVTLDGQANDGAPGENDNTQVDDVTVFSFAFPPGSANLTGDAGTNQLNGDEGNDTINGGAGNDFLAGNSGDDTITANDGFADRVSCGSGTDTANIDNFDVLVSDDCETVNTTQFATLASEDKPPTVAWTAPASAAKLSTKTTNTLSVTATDDKGISQVVFLDDEKVVCTDTTAPYTCDYRPTGGDVGRNTLVAMAIDTSQQTATAVRTVTVPRFAPRSVTSSTKPKSDTSGPRTFTTTGRVNRPTGVTAGQGCKGKVTVTFKAGKKTISTRRVNLRKNCRYSSKVTFSIPSRLAGRLQVVVRFAGNAVLTGKSAKRGRVTT